MLRHHEQAERIRWARTERTLQGASTLAAAQAASRVLFGMVVREQRRVTSLARATLALQEKLEEADAQIEAKEAALRAHMEEERHERVSRAQDEQEQILSLMSLVQPGETQQPNIEEADAVGVDSLVIMLVEETRITFLEKQVVGACLWTYVALLERLQMNQASRYAEALRPYF
eukprot:scaffold106310_cov73-Attheya_sp.AAC.1